MCVGEKGAEQKNKQEGEGLIAHPHRSTASFSRLPFTPTAMEGAPSDDDDGDDGDGDGAAASSASPCPPPSLGHVRAPAEPLVLVRTWPSS